MLRNVALARFIVISEPFCGTEDNFYGIDERFSGREVARYDYGAVVQLGEYLSGRQEVEGSNPSRSTNHKAWR